MNQIDRVRILVSKTFSKAGLSALKTKLDLNQFELLPSDFKESDLKARALIIRSKDIVDKNTKKLFPNLEIISSATSGFDHIKYKELLDLNVQTSYSPLANAQSAAELSLFHILNHTKKGNLVLNPKAWREGDMLSSELSSKSISLIGCGRIGEKVLNILLSFGCEDIKIYDPYLSEEKSSSLPSSVKLVSLKEALLSADILSLHCPLTKLSQRIINKESLSLMKNSSVLINCARGALVDSTDLINHLNDKKIAGACLDTFEEEPLEKDSLLREHPLVEWTPHIGAFTAQAQVKSALEAAQQIKSWFKGDKDMIHSLPPKVDWAKDL